jgi:hypothetical protein
MMRKIEAGFALDAGGNPIPLGPGLYGGGRFFASGATYHLFNTCNTWTASMLRVAGFPIAPALAVTADGVMSAVRAAGPADCPAIPPLSPGRK